MSTSVQYAVLARLLTHNNRVHDLEEMINQMQVTIGEPQVPAEDSQQGDLPEGLQINPFADLQDEIDREARASLVTCWLAMPDDYDD